jgi:uncharacterized Tic20 family protein
MPTTAENPYANPVPTAAPLSPADEKQWSVLTHVISIFAGALSAAIIWVIYRDRGPFIRAHAATELNMQLTALLLTVLAFIAAFVSMFASVLTVTQETTSAPPGLGVFLVAYFAIIAVRVLAAIFGIIASRAASKGNTYRYKGVIQFVKA